MNYTKEPQVGVGRLAAHHPLPNRHQVVGEMRILFQRRVSSVGSRKVLKSRLTDSNQQTKRCRFIPNIFIACEKP